MSQENVALAQQAIEAWNRLDLDAFMTAWHPEAEWRPAFPKGTEGTGGVFRGHDGIREAWHNVRAAWSVYQVEPQEVRMVDDSLLVLGRIFARGETSEVAVQPEDGPADILVTVDGQVGTTFAAGETLRVRRAERGILIIRFPSTTFFATLRKKLGWGGLPERDEPT